MQAGQYNLWLLRLQPAHRRWPPVPPTRTPCITRLRSAASISLSDLTKPDGLQKLYALEFLFPFANKLAHLRLWMTKIFTLTPLVGDVDPAGLTLVSIPSCAAPR